MYDGANVHLHRFIFEDAPEAVLVLSREGRVVDRNRAARTAAGNVLASLFEAREPRPEVAALRAAMDAHGHASAEISIAIEVGRARILALEGRRAGDHYLLRSCDVTERRAREAELRHLRAVELTGLVTASVVHDFNNLLTAILGAGAMLAQATEAGSTAHELASEVLDSAERAAVLVRQIRLRTQGHPPRRESINLAAAICEIRSLMARVAGDGISLHLVLDEDAGCVVVDRQALDHVLLNLTANARDAMPRGGRLTIATARVGAVREDRVDCQGADYVALTVSDEGSGMTPEVRERIFERFFTTKDEGRGTGLGLAEAHHFATESGGCITVRSEPGRGTSVILYLPRANPDAPGAATGVPPALNLPAGSETILVADDEDQVRRVVSAVLQQLGYRVLEAASGSAAIEQADCHRGAVHLLLADVALGDMGASTLLDRMRERGHDTKVLLMSGHADRAIEHLGIAPSSVGLRKAFTPAELALRVREVLDAPVVGVHPRA
jgi:signal transduction histidine kinase